MSHSESFIDYLSLSFLGCYFQGLLKYSRKIEDVQALRSEPFKEPCGGKALNFAVGINIYSLMSENYFKLLCCIEL